ncbi:MAG: hypothetical protein FDX21_07315 [Chlorobium sp.]|nr:MAG: hypothetical protein FDX21_07315 [Chlorobium sp.]
MSQAEAKLFIDKLKSDEALRDRLLEFIRSEGFSCTLSEIRFVEWDAVMKHFNIEGNNPYCRISGYEHWTG